MITLHSYSELVLWPWGWTGTDAPNHAQLQTLGRKFAYFNSYTPQQSNNLYPTNGTTDDWAYGELGIASYTFEMGTTFFQGCTTFESTIWPDNRDALLYALTVADTPYMSAYGPDALSAAISPNPVPRGAPASTGLSSRACCSGPGACAAGPSTRSSSSRPRRSRRRCRPSCCGG